MIRYRETLPPAALRHAIECIWTLEGNGQPDDPPSRILPDGCTELVLNLGDPVRRHHEDGTIEWQPRVLVIGQITRPVLIRPGSLIDLVGIRFQPAGARLFLGVPAKALAGRSAALHDVHAALAREITDELAQATTHAARLARIIRVLERRLASSRDTSGDATVRAAVRCILRTHGSVQIDALAAALGMNARGLQRRFEGWVGLTPKTLARLARFQHVFHALQLGDDAWAGIAVRCGYYDQSHLLRDFRDFAGESPAALLSRELPITHAFTRARRVSDSSYL